jgi:hypothetical protein
MKFDSDNLYENLSKHPKIQIWLKSGKISRHFIWKPK